MDEAQTTVAFQCYLDASQQRLNRARLLLMERLADLRPATSCEPPPADRPSP
jgi:hypothetical protein